jgi:adenine-specific DNA-methyltransferase
MIEKRMKLCYELLTDDGVIFISIDDNSIEDLKMIMNEKFGRENFISQIV